jgi:hypothetical protein
MILQYWQWEHPETLSDGTVKLQIYNFFIPQPIKNALATVFFMCCILHNQLVKEAKSDSECCYSKHQTDPSGEHCALRSCWYWAEHSRWQSACSSCSFASKFGCCEPAMLFCGYTCACQTLLFGTVSDRELGQSTLNCKLYHVSWEVSSYGFRILEVIIMSLQIFLWDKSERY